MRPLFVLTVSAFVLAVSAPAIRPAVAYGQELAPGPGADLVVQACSSCHSLDHVTSVRKDAGGWRDTVMAMVQNGATLTEAQIDEVSNYLTAHYSLKPPPAAAAPASAGVATAPAQVPPSTTSR